jgi:hypothetical protein
VTIIVKVHIITGEEDLISCGERFEACVVQALLTRQNPNQILMRRFRREGRAIDIERTGSNISVNHTNTLICKIQQELALEDLLGVRVKFT